MTKYHYLYSRVIFVLFSFVTVLYPIQQRNISFLELGAIIPVSMIMLIMLRQPLRRHTKKSSHDVSDTTAFVIIAFFATFLNIAFVIYIFIVSGATLPPYSEITKDSIYFGFFVFLGSAHAMRALPLVNRGSEYMNAYIVLVGMYLFCFVFIENTILSIQLMLLVRLCFYTALEAIEKRKL